MKLRGTLRLRQGQADMVDMPVHQLLDVVNIPTAARTTPWKLIGWRFAYAILLIVAIAFVSYFDRGGYSEPLSFIDALYYSAVSLSTTGYGDITPVTQSARLVNIFVVTPARVAFLMLLVGTTLSVLTEDSRKTLQIQQWRNTLRNHTIVLGYGTKGRSAVEALLAGGASPGSIVVVDSDPVSLSLAEKKELVTVRGDATRSEVLRVAGVGRARSVVVAPSSDDTAVLITLSVRELAPSARIVASVRESENQHLLMQSGADSVVVSSETAGRLLGIATVTPPVVEMVEDLLSPDEGFAVAQRPIDDDEVGANPRHLADIVLGVVRSGELYRIDSPEAETVEPGDRLLYVRMHAPGESKQGDA
ncbi:TrkA family potassium uptake protein [Corynebacterium sp. Marseille-P4321]|uniref:potassium channel family protein n=1 Tax=Corynebacterium sp. Marseille-P4321 TaxID=2736603 RepID=UPI000892F3C3|nr:potassium channel family protein [Corynebacterium sp. Marseille-P4321]OEY27043.1 Ion channel protein [Corynebacterium sp. BCW_4722]